MLSFAASSASAKARDAVLSRVPARHADESRAQCGTALGEPAAHLCANPRAPSASHSHYWPCELLNAFILRMAAAGRCVNTAMMLGHKPYALEQLAAARAMPDAGLHAVANRLQAYFDVAAPRGCEVVAAID